MQIVQICTFFFPVHAKSVVVPSFEGQNWPIFYKISIYVITCAKLHKYGLNGGWDLWCWWWWWGISQENDDFQAEPWHLLQGAKVDCYNFTPTQPHDDGDDSHIIIMLILIPIIIFIIAIIRSDFWFVVFPETLILSLRSFPERKTRKLLKERNEKVHEKGEHYTHTV